MEFRMRFKENRRQSVRFLLFKTQHFHLIENLSVVNRSIKCPKNVGHLNVEIVHDNFFFIFILFDKLRIDGFKRHLYSTIIK